ncbi:hypothetical protein AAE478_005487 [Parahypoxylon ruwenzoriense]
MAPLTRKRKAEMEAASQAAEAGRATSPKRVRLAEEFEEPQQAQLPRRKDPFKRIDPFRPLSPRPTEVRRRKIPFPVKLWKLNQKEVPRHPLPVLFFTEPEVNPGNQWLARSRSSNEVDTIVAAKSLLVHAEKYGAVALPSKEALESWLEANKDQFIRARQANSNARQPTPPAQRVQNAPRRAAVIGAFPETPDAHHPAVRAGEARALPFRQRAGAALRRAARHTRHAAAELVRAARHHLAGALEVTARVVQPAPAVGEGPTETSGEVELVRDVEQREEEEAARRAAVLEAVEAGEIQPLRVRTVAPPLDPRFFHPNGQLQTVYKYLTGQIPLPRQWVAWAISNGIYTVDGRGDIRESGCYVAEDTFDYDTLYLAIRRGHFRTGRREIDSFPEHWPVAGDLRDNYTVDLELHRFTGPSPQRTEEPSGPEQDPKGKGKQLPSPSSGPARSSRSVAASPPAPAPASVPASGSDVEAGPSRFVLDAETPRGVLTARQEEIGRLLASRTPGRYPVSPSSSDSPAPSPRTPSPVGPMPYRRAPPLAAEASASAGAQNEATAPRSSGTFGLPEDFYDRDSDSDYSIVEDDPSPATANPAGEEWGDDEALPETPTHLPPRPSAPTPGRGAGIYGLPPEFYDSSSSSNHDEDEDEDEAADEAAEAQRREGARYLAQSRTALREEFRDAGRWRRVPSPRPASS